MQTLARQSVLLNAQGYKTKVSEENEEIRERVAKMYEGQLCHEAQFTNTELQDFKILYGLMLSLVVCLHFKNC